MTSISSYTEKKNLWDCIRKNLYRNIIYSYVEKKNHAHKEQILKFSLSTWNLNQELLAIIPAFALIWVPSCPQELALGMPLEWIAGFWDRGQAMVKDFPFWKQPISMLDISYCDTASLFIKSTKLAHKILLEPTWSLLGTAQSHCLCTKRNMGRYRISEGRNRMKAWLCETDKGKL